MEEPREPPREDRRDGTSQETEAVLMAIWRRVIEEGCGPEMSLTEAAAVLGASVQSVRRRVSAGVIPAYRDAKGRIRIVPRLNIEGTSGPEQIQESPRIVARLMDELKNTKAQLNQAVRDRSVLQNQMAAAEQALEHTKDELGAMWRLLSARNSKEVRPAEKTRPVQPVVPEGATVSKIQSQITAVRKLAKRRKWPWVLVA